jgi:PIF1-like helicase
MMKQHQDTRAAAEKTAVDQGNQPKHGKLAVQLFSSQVDGLALKNPSEARENLPRPNYARIGSYADLNEDDFVFDGTSSDRAYYIDDDNKQPQSLFRSMKRSNPDSPDSYAYNKKLKTAESGFIDLTSSPPERDQGRYDRSMNYYPTSWDGSSSPSRPISDPTTEPLLSSSHAYKYSTSAKSPPTYTLDDCSPEQRLVLDLVSQGKNVFFTGSAGVGKSFVLQKINELLKAQGLKQFSDFFITASTGSSFYNITEAGIAAVQIGGTTVHSFSGVGKGEDGVLALKERIERRKLTRNNWKECKVLVIDEVSMVTTSIYCETKIVIGRFVRQIR